MVFVVHLHLHLYSSVLLSPSYIRAATPELNYNIGCTHSMVSKLFTLITLWVKASSQYSIGFHTGCLILMVSSYSLPHEWKYSLYSLWKPFIILKIPFSLVFLRLFILSQYLFYCVSSIILVNLPCTLPNTSISLLQHGTQSSTQELACDVTNLWFKFQPSFPYSRLFRHIAIKLYAELFLQCSTYEI